MCSLSLGILNKRREVLESLVSTKPQAALLCSPLCFPSGQLISTCCFILRTSIVAMANIWFRLYDNNRMHAEVKALGDLIHTYLCVHNNPTSLSVTVWRAVYTCRSNNIFSAHLDAKGNTKQCKTFRLSFSLVKHSWQDNHNNLYNKAGNIKYSGTWLFRSVDLLEWVGKSVHRRTG